MNCCGQIFTDVKAGKPDTIIIYSQQEARWDPTGFATKLATIKHFCFLL